MSKTKDKSVPHRLLMVLEYLPACGMSFYRAGVRAGYKPSYARKIGRKFANDVRLQQMLKDRIQRVLQEVGETDREIVTKLLQEQHTGTHPVTGTWFLPPRLSLARM